jgi:hypothetical protein
MRVSPWLLALGLSASLVPADIFGQDVSVRAYVAPSATVGVGRPFTLNVEVSGAQSVDRDPALPDLATFAQFLGSNTQSSVQMVNGRTSVTLTIQYRYQALSEGAFQIPAFDVEAGGQTFTTEPIDLIVSAAPPDDPNQAGGIGADDLFITAEPSASSVIEGEPFVVEYRIWTRVDVSNFGITSVPEPEGFWVEDITPEGQPSVEQLTRNGVQYATAVVRRVALVPTGPGERTIDPIGVEAQVRVQRTLDPFSDFFGRSSLFGSSTVSTTVLSNPVSIEVAPLPPGRPEPFSGVVGSLSVSADLDRDSVDANEAVTFTVRVSGEGNLGVVPAPELTFPPDFEVFPPEVTESVRPSGTGLSGSKTFEYVLIPRAPGNREVPSARRSGGARSGWSRPAARGHPVHQARVARAQASRSTALQRSCLLDLGAAPADRRRGRARAPSSLGLARRQRRVRQRPESWSHREEAIGGGQSSRGRERRPRILCRGCPCAAGVRSGSPQSG